MSFNFADILAAILAQQGGLPPAPGATPVPTPAPAPAAAPAPGMFDNPIRRQATGSQDGPFAYQGPTVTRGFGQDAVTVPADQAYYLGGYTGGGAQERTPLMGGLQDLQAKNPDMWYLDPQVRALPESQTARQLAFEKGPANPNSWWEWANHLEKFYGINAVVQAAQQGFFDYVPDFDPDALGRHIAQRQDRGDDPIFGNTGITTDQAIMTLLGAGFGGLTGGAFAGGEAAATAPSAEALAVAGNSGALPATGLNALLEGMPAWMAPLAKTYGMNLVTSGDPLAAAKGTVLGAGINYGANVSAPYVNDAFDYFSAPPADLERLKYASADTGMLDVQPPAPFISRSSLSGPASVIGPDGIARSAQQNAAGTWSAPADGQSYVGDPLNSSGMLPGMAMPPAVRESDPTQGGTLKETQPGVYTPAPAPTVTPADLERYAKIGLQINGLIGAHDGPTRPAADASPEEQQKYYSDVVNYLGLDAQTMADAGLTPGTPEYTKYILDQADAIISQVMGDLDVNADDLAAQLRTKTDQELQQLQRALYVRGQLGTQAGAGTYTDPFTGTSQEVVGPGMFDPNTAAYQRGLAGSVDQLGGLRGSQAYDYLQEMLNRQGDPFGAQAQQDQRFEEAKRNDEAQRRRGMFSGSY